MEISRKKLVSPGGTPTFPSSEFFEVCVMRRHMCFDMYREFNKQPLTYWDRTYAKKFPTLRATKSSLTMSVIVVELQVEKKIQVKIMGRTLIFFPYA